MGPAGLTAAFAGLGVASVALVVALTRRELSGTTRAGQRAHVTSSRSGPPAASALEAGATGLTEADWARLEAFRGQARLLAAAGEPLGKPGVRARLEAARRDGHTLLLAFAVVGCANLAMHLGAAALLLGASFAAAAAVGVVSMVALSVVAVATILSLLASS